MEFKIKEIIEQIKLLNDSDFYKVPVSGLTDSQYIAKRMSDFDPDQAGVSQKIGAGQPVESCDRVHAGASTLVYHRSLSGCQQLYGG